MNTVPPTTDSPMTPAEINPPAPQSAAPAPAAPAVDEWVDALTAGEAPAANPHYHCSTQDTRPCPTGEHANPAPVAAHRHVAGWGGVPGQCGVECACGTTFDNFNMIDEAAALLDDHIVREQLRQAGFPLADETAVRALEEMDTAVMAAAAEDEPVLARDAGRFMLLSHTIDGENVGIEIRHVEPSDDGEKVLIVLAGGGTRWYRVDEQLDVLDKKNAEAAQGRLRDKRRRAEQVAILRKLADLAASGLPLPFFLRMEGSLGSLEEIKAAAAMLGCEADEQDNGRWHISHTFGADTDHSFSAPVELQLVHYVRTKP